MCPVPSTRTHKRPTTCPCSASHLSWAHVVTKCVSSLSNSPARRAGSLKFLPSKCTRCEFFHQGCNHNNTTNPPKHPATIIPTCCSCSLLQITPQQQIPTPQLSRVAHLKMRKVTQLSLRGFAKVPTLQGSFPCSHATARSHKPQDELISRHGQQRHVVQLLSPGTAEIDMASLNGTKKNKNKNKSKMMKEKNAPMLSNTFPQGD